jgi:hypothetical protein
MTIDIFMYTYIRIERERKRKLTQEAFNYAHKFINVLYT